MKLQAVFTWPRLLNQLLLCHCCCYHRWHNCNYVSTSTTVYECSGINDLISKASIVRSRCTTVPVILCPARYLATCLILFAMFTRRPVRQSLEQGARLQQLHQGGSRHAQNDPCRNSPNFSETDHACETKSVGGLGE